MYSFSKKAFRPTIYLAIAFVFLLVFSVDTSPITGDYYGSDSALFMLFGKCMNKGYVIYRDLFDLKGPYLFFLQQLGQLIVSGKTGAFIIQFISLVVSIYLITKILHLSDTNLSFIKELMIVLLILYFFAGTISGGNLTEEFSLPFLLLSLYLFIKYIKSKSYSFNIVYSFIYGVLFSFFAFSRITNSAFLCSIILVVYSKLIINREYKNLLLNAITFVAGIVVASLPIIIYYYLNNALSEMIYDTFVYAFLYSGDLSFKERIANYFTIEKIVFLLPVFFPLIICAKTKKDNKELFALSIISTIVTIIATFLGKSYLHYFILVIPNIVLGFYLYLKNINVFSIKKVTILILVVILLQGYFVTYNLGKSFVKITDHSYSENVDHYYENKANLMRDVASKIPDDEKDNVWGYGIKSKFYLITDTYPCLKHFDYLEQHLSIGNVAEEVRNDLNVIKPKWIVISKESEDIPLFIYNFINTNYNVSYENSEYYLYCLK